MENKTIYSARLQFEDEHEFKAAFYFDKVTSINEAIERAYQMLESANLTDMNIVGIEMMEQVELESIQLS